MGSNMTGPCSSGKQFMSTINEALVDWMSRLIGGLTVIRLSFKPENSIILEILILTHFGYAQGRGDCWVCSRHDVPGCK